MTVIRKLLTIVFYRPEKEWFVSERTDAVALQGGICRARGGYISDKFRNKIFQT